MKTYLSQFETIGGVYASKLRQKMKILTVDEFLDHSLEEINRETQIDMDRLEEWLEVFDLYRVPNISPRYAELLRFANINSVEELAYRQTIRIFYKLQEIDEKTFYIILQLPTFAEIENWIYYAKLMVKRIKFGENIPIILLSFVNFEIAGILKKFNIFTVEDFRSKENSVPHLRKKLGMKRSTFEDMKKFIEMLRIDGIDLLTAKILWKAGYETVDAILDQNPDELISKLQDVAELDSEKRAIPKKVEAEKIMNHAKVLQEEAL